MGSSPPVPPAEPDAPPDTAEAADKAVRNGTARHIWAGLQ